MDWRRLSVILQLSLVLCFVNIQCRVEAAEVVLGFDLYQDPDNCRYPVFLHDVNAWIGTPNKTLPVSVQYLGWAQPATLEKEFKKFYEIWNAHTVPMITWMPYPYDSWWSRTPNEDIVWGEQRLLYSAYIYEFTARLTTFLHGEDGQPDTADDRRAYLCFAPAPNGNWFPWTPRYTGEGMNVTQTPQSYVTLWNTVIGQVRKRIPSRRQLQVVWDVNAGDACAVTCRAEDFMPDRDLVDWLQITGYNWGSLIPSLGWRDMGLTFGEMLARLRSLANKPVVLLLASTDLRVQVEVEHKQAWLDTMIPYARQKGISMLIYRNSNEQGGLPFHHFAVIWDAANPNVVSAPNEFAYQNSSGARRQFRVFANFQQILRDNHSVVLADASDARCISDEVFFGTHPARRQVALVWVVLSWATVSLIAIVGLLAFIWRWRRAYVANSPLRERLLLRKETMVGTDLKKKELISESTYCHVYRVVHQETGAVYAAKFINIADEQNYQMSLNEVDKLHRCQGLPHVTRFYNTDMSWHSSYNANSKVVDSSGNIFGSANSTPPPTGSIQQQDDEDSAMIVMKYYKDGDLDKYISKQSIQLPFSFVVSVTAHITEALLAMHTLKKGVIVHCGVAPENVLLEDGQAYLADFSHAMLVRLRVTALAEDAQRHVKAKCLLVRDWSAPEVAEARHFTPAMDVWGIGCLLYSMMTRRTFTHDRNSKAECEETAPLRELVRTEMGIVELRRSLFTYPEALVALMFDCLAIVPSSRPSISEIYKSLQLLL